MNQGKSPEPLESLKTVLITGGGTGLGLEIARQLVVHGYNILLLGRRREVIDSAVEELRALKVSTANLAGQSAAGQSAMSLAGRDSIKGYSGDVSDLEEMKALFATWHREGIAVDVLVNNAGVISPITYLADSDIAAWKNILLVNTFGVYLMTRLALPGMLLRGGGTVVNISSGSAHRPLEGWSAYCTSKAGMKMLNDNLHLEYAERGIRVFNYRPGMVDTPMQEAIRHSGINQVSKVPKEDLLSPVESARPAVWFIHSAPHDSEKYRGQEIDIRDPGFRERIGLRSYG